MAVGRRLEAEFTEADEGRVEVGRARRGAQGQRQGHEIAGAHMAPRQVVGDDFHRLAAFARQRRQPRRQARVPRLDDLIEGTVGPQTETGIDDLAPEIAQIDRPAGKRSEDALQPRLGSRDQHRPHVILVRPAFLDELRVPQRGHVLPIVEQRGPLARAAEAVEDGRDVIGRVTILAQ